MQAADHCIASTIPQGVLVAHLRRGVNGTQANRARNPFRRDRGAARVGLLRVDGHRQLQMVAIVDDDTHADRTSRTSYTAAHDLSSG